MKEQFEKLHQWLLPCDSSTFRYAPYVWLVYLSIFFTSLVASQPNTTDYGLSFLGIALFLCFYFHGYRSNSKTIIIDILGILTIGTLLALITPGASVFFVYAGAFCCRLGGPKKAFFGLGIILISIAIVSLMLELSPYFYVPAILFSILIGGVNIYEFEMSKTQQELILSQQEVKSLAKTAERERIARDLHDLIGHTFSVINLKAQLANKLLDKRSKHDIEKAKQEVFELEKISRESLQQIREVVSGYRTSDLSTELAHAKYVLESNDISFQYQMDELDISDTINKELAIVLKELVTNSLKHANAENANVSIQSKNGMVTFVFSDDGVGIQNSKSHGFGLQGIGERIGKLGGTFRIEPSPGASFTIQVPILAGERA